MFDKSTDEDEVWRKLVPARGEVKRYLGTQVTASQWVYFAYSGDEYCLVFVQRWFKCCTVTRVRTVNPVDWQPLPPGKWVPISDSGWSQYEVDDE
jgi:hypothetical protein